MKKFFATIMSLAMIVSFVSCGSEQSGQTTDQGKKQPSITADYTTGSVEEWAYSSGQTDELSQLLNKINTVTYGLEDSDLKKVSAAVSIIMLSENEDAVNSIETFMSDMTDTQKDYFSFSWEMAAETADEIFEHPDRYSSSLYDAGYQEFNISQHSEEQFDNFDDMVEKRFEAMGITEEWENHEDIFPFSEEEKSDD